MFGGGQIRADSNITLLSGFPPSAFLWSVIHLVLKNMLSPQKADVVQLSQRARQGTADFCVHKGSIVHFLVCWWCLLFGDVFLPIGWLVPKILSRDWFENQELAAVPDQMIHVRSKWAAIWPSLPPLFLGEHLPLLSDVDHAIHLSGVFCFEKIHFPDFDGTMWVYSIPKMLEWWSLGGRSELWWACCHIKEIPKWCWTGWELPLAALLPRAFWVCNNIWRWNHGNGRLGAMKVSQHRSCQFWLHLSALLMSRL